MRCAKKTNKSKECEPCKPKLYHPLHQSNKSKQYNNYHHHGNPIKQDRKEHAPKKVTIVYILKAEVLS
jgi:hypothetical protein